MEFCRQGALTDRGAGPGGSERAAEEKRRHTAETERHNTYKDFQGKLEKETEKASYACYVKLCRGMD